MSDCEDNDDTTLNLEFFIHGVPRELMPSDLKYLIRNEIDPEKWHCIGTIITRDSKIVHVSCETLDVYERFFFEVDLKRLLPNADITLWPANCPEIFPAANEYEQMMKDFQQLPFTEQVQLYKSGGKAKEVVNDIWTLKYHKLYYSPEHFEDNYNCIITKRVLRKVGRFVKQLTFNTNAQDRDNDGDSICKYQQKRIIRRNSRRLCSAIMYLTNLQILEVQGHYLKDKIIKHLALHCDSLATIRLLDINTRKLTGRHMYRFPALRNVNLNYCSSLRKTMLMKLCSQNLEVMPLERLSVVGVPCLSRACHQLKLCSYLRNISELRLSAVKDGRTVAAILGLEQLRVLALYWLSDFGPFELLLLGLLCEKRADSCVSLKFVVDRPPFENQWYWRKSLTDYDYDIQREIFAIAGTPWGSDYPDDQYTNIWTRLTQLKAISFEYCRPLTSQQLMQLPVLRPNLQIVQLIGCPANNDFNMHQKWQTLYPKCTFRLVLKIPFRDVKDLETTDLEDDFVTQRYIECRFGRSNKIE